MSASLLLKGRIKSSIIDHEGNLVKEFPWQPNLILDQGLDRIAEMPIVDIFAYAAKGTGVTTTYDTPSGTSSQSGNTVTATASIFSIGMVGALIRWTGGADSGTEKRIVSYASATSVDVDGDPESVASGAIRIYHVNQTGLIAENGPRTNTYSSVSGENATTTVGNKRTLKRTFVFAPETTTTTYYEVGFSHEGTPGTNLNIRVRLASGVTPSGPVGAIPGQRLKLTYELDLFAEPETATAGALNAAISDPGSDMSSNKNSTYIVETFATSRIALSGESDTTLMDLEPSVEGHMGFSSDTTALDFNSSAQRTANLDYVPLEFVDDYIAGTFKRTLSGTFELEDANRTDLRSLMLFNPESNNSIVTYLFSANQKKDANHSLTIEWEKSWGRDLS